MNDVAKRYLWLVALMAAIGFVADQASKYVVFAQLATGDHQQEVIPGHFELRVAYTDKDDQGDVPVLSFLRTISSQRLPHVNKGALFGIGNTGDGLNWLFALVSVAAAVFIVYWVRRPAVAADRFLCLSLGLILGGTLGNLYDRVVFDGVRDFLHFYYIPEGAQQPQSWPDFNIADCCLVCGACVLLVHSFLVKEKADEPAKTEVSALHTTTPATGA